jgi:hypothetical protein
MDNLSAINNAPKILSFSLCMIGLFFFASQTMAAQPPPLRAKTGASRVQVFNADTMAKAQKEPGDSDIKNAGKAEILSKALRVRLGEDFMAYFSLEPPRGIEAVREELESKSLYRAVFGFNIPL